MLIVCPSCASEYIIDPAQIGADGRTVRCAACRGTFFVAGEPDVSDDELAETEAFNSYLATQAWPEPDPPLAVAATAARSSKDAPTERPERRGRSRLAGLGRLAARMPRPPAAPLLACLLLAVAAGLVGWRETVVRNLPATARLYAAVRLPVNPSGLELRGVRSELVVDGTDRLLVVEGDIRNVAKREIALPALELAVRGPDGRALYTWTSEAARKTLAPAEAERFRARLAAPPADGREVLVRFAQGGAGAVAPKGP